MRRLEKANWRYNDLADKWGWKRDPISANSRHIRKVTYCKGQDHINIWFSRFFYEVVTIEVWDSKTNRLETWHRNAVEDLDFEVIIVMFQKRLQEIVDNSQQKA